MIKKLKCHCGNVEAEVNIPDNGIEKIMRCNCSICKKKGYVIGVLGENDFKLTKGKDSLKLYQFYTNTAKHYFCTNCGIHTHNRPRINPKIYGINVACIDDIDVFKFKDVAVNDGRNHPLDKNKMSQISACLNKVKNLVIGLYQLKKFLAKNLKIKIKC